jgi:hypothetical protein
MQPRLIRRRAHTRRLANSRLALVRESWVLSSLGQSERRNSFRHPCPCCASPIISVRMPNGGWTHFEGKEGLERMKHPCMHLGERLSKKRDEETLDLFCQKAAG